jgi:hypothetical protein
MAGIDFLKLMNEGLVGMTESDLDTLVRSLMPNTRAMKEEFSDSSQAIRDFLDEMFFNLSKEVAKKRERIIRLAEEKSGNPKNQSEYCLRALRHEFSQWRRSQFAREHFPENHRVNRQVERHLNTLRKKGLFRSHELNVPSRQYRGSASTLDEAENVKKSHIETQRRRILAVLWGLSEWGPEMHTRRRGVTKAKLLESLPDIPTGEGGKGVFRYERVLPDYLILILQTFGAPLSTAEIKSIVRNKARVIAFPSVLAPMSPEYEGRPFRIGGLTGHHRSELSTTAISENQDQDEVSGHLEPNDSRLLLADWIRRLKAKK